MSAADYWAQPTGVEPAADLTVIGAVYGGRWLIRMLRRRQKPADPQLLPKADQPHEDTGNVQVLPPTLDE